MVSASILPRHDSQKSRSVMDRAAIVMRSDSRSRGTGFCTILFEGPFGSLTGVLKEDATDSKDFHSSLPAAVQWLGFELFRFAHISANEIRPTTSQKCSGFGRDEVHELLKG
ncbi:hypothetical protein CDAR_289151 [Caerostris darwini]|uniref:Uncharacterized protein n=1 Tax=Caerostris darwini TaxID=1538125 RepID=A0AAV4PGP4_9ARAC|nr:hypothetical protein CDAR_289151 [Caerostris darwini]